VHLLRYANRSADRIAAWQVSTRSSRVITLAALTVDPDDARVRSASWRDLPIEQIGELRRQKNLTSHVDRLLDILRPAANWQPRRRQTIGYTG
jgi:hypothetical protein